MLLIFGIVWVWCTIYNFKYLKYIVVKHCHESFTLRVLMWDWITLINICNKFNDHTPWYDTDRKDFAMFHTSFIISTLTRNGNGINISICEQIIYCHCSHSLLPKFHVRCHIRLGAFFSERAILMAQWRKEIIHILWFLHKWARSSSLWDGKQTELRIIS